jgi:hypothetical protein
VTRTYAGTLLAALLAAGPLHAQLPAAEPTVSGRVVDATTSAPLATARVTLEPLAMGAFGTRPAGSAFLHSTRSTLSDSAGEYRFGGVGAGGYRLRVERIGYQPATLEVQVRPAGGSRVSVGLSLEAVALRPLEVSATAVPADGAYGRDVRRALDAEGEGDHRIAAERARQRRYLASDARAVTHADVEEGVTLGETDLFRALQRLPGIGTRDDYAAELWVRGAPWSQTQVRFDGIPLWNPVHALGVFSGVNPDAVGAVFLHPGVQPASVGGGAAGAIEIESRRGGEGPLNARGELSLASGRVALDGTSRNGRASWMTAHRRSYVDWLASAAERLTGDLEWYLPYVFYDATARHDYQVGDRSRVETSVLYEFDEVRGSIPDVLHGSAATWGSGATRVSFSTPVGGLRSRHTAGFSGVSSTVRPTDAGADREGGYTAPRARHSSSNLYYFTVGGAWEPDGEPSRPAPWAAGYELVTHDNNFAGPAPIVYRGVSDVEPVYDHGQLVFGVLWAERRWSPAERLAVQTGLRLEGGPGVVNGGALRASPRLSARYQLRPELSLSAGAGRSFQYVQTIGAVGPGWGSVFASGHLRLLAGSEVPALRSDIATAGAEWWIGHGWLAAANAYLRRSSGVAVPDPAPGEIIDRPLFVDASTEAQGVELSARRLAGRWTLSAGYTLGSAVTEAGGVRFASEQDRRHSFDATSLVRLGRSWRLGAAYSAATGNPYTRFFEGDASCDDYGERCTWTERSRVEAPSAERMPAYASLDLLADWNHSFRGWDFGAYLQLRNALGRRNPAAYLRSYDHCGPSGGFHGTPSCAYDPGPKDEFVPALPILPLLGFRVSF